MSCGAPGAVPDASQPRPGGGGEVLLEPYTRRQGIGMPIPVTDCNSKMTGLGGFEPPTSGLEARRYVLAKPQTPVLFPYILVRLPA